MKNKDYNYRLINAIEKLPAKEINSLENHIETISDELKPKKYQGIAINGHIIIKGTFHPDATIKYSTPRKEINYGLDDIEIELKEEILKQKNDLRLTKIQVTELKKTVNEADRTITDINRKIDIIKNKALALKESSDMEKYVDDFFKKYSAFSQCLTSQLNSLDIETKDEIREKLSNLIDLIADITKSYLQSNT